MNKIVKDQIKKLRPSATLVINEESNKLIKSGKKVYKFGFGQSPFPIPDSVVTALKNNANKNTYLPMQGLEELRLAVASNLNKVNKNNFVLDDTLERNIAFANKEIDKNKLDLAIKLSGLENFNLKLKDQFNRNLGENASKISGGELQRIALARALYADKDILILDEFTSSLDKKNEKKIFETMLKLNKTKTILVVSHNTEISKIAKKSFKIENRKIINFS